MTKAFVLAAGQGKRFLPFSKRKPKPLFKIGDVSLIENNLNNLKNCGVDEVVINVFHLGEKIIDSLGDGSKYGLKISYSIENELLGTGGGITNAIHFFEESFIVLSGDVWTDFDFSTLKIEEGRLAHMVLIKNPISNKKGDVYLKDNLVETKGEGSTLTYSGISLLSPELFYNKEIRNYGLWEEILLPASRNNLVSGELYNGLLDNLNTVEEAEKLDALLTGE
ncbi:MAG: mannose-1-phosphate guanylyltransferase [Gammaproteobacteria bacterium]|nr:mannose-1-phosphate guanylyltransferase [Gammaproteobacteria bacterium]